MKRWTSSLPSSRLEERLLQTAEVVAIGIAVELLGSWAESGTTGTTRSPTNTQVASRVVIGRQIAGQIVVGQALRLLVARLPCERRSTHVCSQRKCASHSEA